MVQLHSTTINLSPTVRENVTALLNQRVGLFTDLFVQTKLAHWNVRGRHFIAYHELFDSIASHILNAQDMLAERAATLGGSAGMTVQDVGQKSTLPVWSMTVRQDTHVIRLLQERLGHVANEIRHDIDTTAQWGDADTTDLFTEVSRQLDKDLWFLEAHLDV